MFNTVLKLFRETNYTFDGQRDGERVNLFLYRHWITIILKLFFLGLIILFPIIPLFALSGIIATYHFFIIILFYMFVWSSAFYSITMYLLDSWIVTDNRVIDMTQHGYFSRTVSEMSLSKIQDISVKVTGIVPTMFGYGNVEIQSAGAVDKFIFKDVPNPNQVKDQIMDLVNKARGEEKHQI